MNIERTRFAVFPFKKEFGVIAVFMFLLSLAGFFLSGIVLVVPVGILHYLFTLVPLHVEGVPATYIQAAFDAALSAITFIGVQAPFMAVLAFLTVFPVKKMKKNEAPLLPIESFEARFKGEPLIEESKMQDKGIQNIVNARCYMWGVSFVREVLKYSWPLWIAYLTLPYFIESNCKGELPLCDPSGLAVDMLFWATLYVTFLAMEDILGRYTIKGPWGDWSASLVWKNQSVLQPAQDGILMSERTPASNSPIEKFER